jgi:hypothetical protein
MNDTYVCGQRGHPRLETLPRRSLGARLEQAPPWPGEPAPVR